MPKIHRFASPVAHDFHCKDDDCDWPKYRKTFTRSIEESMEHIRDTGHEVYFAITERCSIMPDDTPVLAPTAEDWMRWRGMSVSDFQDCDIS